MTINPRIGVWLSIAIAVLGVLASASTQLTTIFGEHTASIIMASAILLMTIGSAVSAVLHAIPAAVPATDKEANKFALGPVADKAA